MEIADTFGEVRTIIFTYFKKCRVYNSTCPPSAAWLCIIIPCNIIFTCQQCCLIIQYFMVIFLTCNKLI